MIRAVSFACLSASFLFSQTPDPAQLQHYFEEGEKALVERRYDAAAKAYERLRELDPGTAEVHAKLGVIYFQDGKYSQAVPALRQALKLKPGLPNADVLLAMSLSELGQYKEALPGLEKGFRGQTDPALKRMAGLQLQRAYTGLRRDGEAVSVALELARLYPKDPEVLYHTSRLFANFAYLTMSKLSQTAPDSIWTIQALAEAQESQGAYDYAISHYRRILEIDPARAGIHFRLGQALQARSQRGNAATQDLAAAVKEFELELELDSTNANAAYEFGEIYRSSGEFEKARQFFASAIRHYPDFQEAEVGLGRTLLALQQPDQALIHLRKAITLDPDDEVAHYHLAQVYGALENKVAQQKAIAEFQRLRSERSRREDIFLRHTVTKQEANP